MEFIASIPYAGSVTLFTKSIPGLIQRHLNENA